MNARVQAIEVLAEAMWDARHDGNAATFENMHPTGKALYLKMAAASIDALLATRQHDELCPSCEGDWQGARRRDANGRWLICPDCTAGRVPGAPLVILRPERVGWWFPPGMSLTRDQWDDDLVAVYKEPT